MSKKKFDINRLYYIKTIVSSFIRSSFHYILHTVGKFVSFIKQHKQISIKLFIPLLIVCIAYHACSASKRTIKQNIREIFDISDEIRTHYTDKPDYWGLSVAEIVAKNMLPSKFLRNKAIVLSSGTSIAIGSGINAEAVMPFSQTFDIILKNLNKAQCISYAEATLNEEDLLKVSSIHIFNRSGEFSFEWGGERKLPIHRYDTKDLCSDTDNIVIWSIK